jgi:predicted DNA-binding protein YlxM (UPF0122 family)
MAYQVDHGFFTTVTIADRPYLFRSEVENRATGLQDTQSQKKTSFKESAAKKLVVTTDEDINDLISQAEAARRCKISKQAIAKMLREKILTPVEIGKRVVVRSSEVEVVASERKSRLSKRRSQQRRAIKDNYNGCRSQNTETTEDVILDRKNWITQTEAAELRDVTPQAIYDLVKRKRLTTLQANKQTFLKRSEIEAFERATPGPKPKRQRKK